MSQFPLLQRESVPFSWSLFGLQAVNSTAHFYPICWLLEDGCWHVGFLSHPSRMGDELYTTADGLSLHTSPFCMEPFLWMTGLSEGRWMASEGLLCYPKFGTLLIDLLSLGKIIFFQTNPLPLKNWRSCLFVSLMLHFLWCFNIVF